MKFAGEVDVPSDVSDDESEFIGIGGDSSDDDEFQQDLENNNNLLGIPPSNKITLSSGDYSRITTVSTTAITNTTIATIRKQQLQ